ncbi:hypothetical protein [Qiania dongpingensis]|uniref:Uncharacterized protein n=1 Tax=Qiania dongpingensis TaxID=2763669 RepID=A0A7G9G608_9FIRM|nr:hypothetical protein [Qiania dongpingensis]QNM06240.1 hypothetical protein H9Q78_03555 [Qiania dongpingensis]
MKRSISKESSYIRWHSGIFTWCHLISLFLLSFTYVSWGGTAIKKGIITFLIWIMSFFSFLSEYKQQTMAEYSTSEIFEIWQKVGDSVENDMEKMNFSTEKEKLSKKNELCCKYLKKEGFENGQRITINSKMIGQSIYSDGTCRIALYDGQTSNSQWDNISVQTNNLKTVLIELNTDVKVECTVMSDDNLLFTEAKVITPDMKQYDFHENIEEIWNNYKKIQGQFVLYGWVDSVTDLTAYEAEIDIAYENASEEDRQLYLCMKYSSHMISITNDTGNSMICFIDTIWNTEVTPGDKIILIKVRAHV